MYKYEWEHEKINEIHIFSFITLMSREFRKNYRETKHTENFSYPKENKVINIFDN